MKNVDVVDQPDSLDAASLKAAFDRFNDSSSRLEARYQTLLEETKSLRERLRQKDLEVKRAERLSLLGETAAALAHEVRNPLGAIKLFISLLRRDVSDRPGAVKLINQVDTSISALDNVVSNILQFSRDKKPTFAPVNVHAILQEQMIAVRPSESSKVFFETDFRGNPFCFGHDSSLRQVFYNLLLNGCQAMRWNGTIKITTSDSEDGLSITITDSGPGIPEEALDNIFDPFFTTKNEGTGLGLAIVRQIIDQHEGRISASQKGGAEFTVVLPRAQIGKR